MRQRTGGRFCGCKFPRGFWICTACGKFVKH